MLQTRELSDVPVHDRVDIAVVPAAPGGCVSNAEHLRIAAAEDRLQISFAGPGRAPEMYVHAIAEQLVDEIVLHAGALGHAERPQVDDPSPASQRLGDCGNRQEACGPGQEKLAWLPMLVDNDLDRSDELVAAALYLVDAQWTACLASERDRVLPGGTQNLVVIEGSHLSSVAGSV